MCLRVSCKPIPGNRCISWPESRFQIPQMITSYLSNHPEDTALQMAVAHNFDKFSWFALTKGASDPSGLLAVTKDRSIWEANRSLPRSGIIVKMSMRKRKGEGGEEELGDTINELLPDILVAAESFKSTTAEKIRRCLVENYNVKVTRSQIQLALENGCRLGLIQERKRYCLNPTFSLNSNCSAKKRGP